MNKLIQDSWYKELVAILKTKQMPNDFSEKRKNMLFAFKEEVNKKIEKILDTPRFDRRLDKRNYKFIKQIRERDGKLCQSCGENGENIKYEVAHIIPVELFPEFAFEEWNARIKCFACNHKNGISSFRKMAKNLQVISNFARPLQSSAL